MNRLIFNSLFISFHRTIRIHHDDKNSYLPPSFGCFELFEIKDIREICQKDWDDNDYVMPIYNKEAMWISFESNTSVNALAIGMSGINVLNGEKFEPVLKRDNYLVTPPQPWLDGWKNKNGTVSQFVSTEENSVGQQILGEEANKIEFAFFEPKKELARQGYPQETCCFAACDMGIGMGGDIIQKVYADPYGLDAWKEKPTKTTNIYLFNANDFRQVTDRYIHPLPKEVEDYYGLWYKLNDHCNKDIQGSNVFSTLEKVK